MRTPPFVRGEEGTEVLSELNTTNKVVGAKQVKRALKDGRAAKVFIAGDADPRVTQPLAQTAVNNGVAVELVSTMKELGNACGISVASATAAVVRN